MEKLQLLLSFILGMGTIIIISIANTAGRGTKEEETLNLFHPAQRVRNEKREPIPQWNNYTIAVDFDKTLCNSKFPECGPPIAKTVNFIKEAKKAGCKIILWTCRVGKDLEAAVRWCRLYGIPLDAVNENLPEHIAFFGNETRKVYANLYIDDRGINPNTEEFPQIKIQEW